MGLFDKKYCDICGDKIGLLGNRKLEDGNCCKNCANKLSVWFSDRRRSTINDIKEQLEYRERNKSDVAAFTVTRKYGEDFKKLLIDENAGKFTVATEQELKNGNPDILDLSAIKEVIQHNDERKSEQKYKDKDGKMVSYVPPKYEYSYDFRFTLKVEHPYIDEMRFDVNSFSIDLKIAAPKNGRVNNAPLFAEYNKYLQLSNEIKDYLEGNDKADANEAPAAGTPAVPVAAPVVEEPWDCPACGAKAQTGKFCEYCGSARP